MITGYFGVPGCGKSTFLSQIAIKELRKIKQGKSAYKHVLTNFPVHGCEIVNIHDLGRYDIQNSLILFDEISMDADSRDYKNFSKSLRDFFILHRHACNDIVYFCQDYEKVDKVIRNLTFDLWYLRKPVFPFLNRFSIAKRIYRNININEYTSELSLGYRFAKLSEIIFSSSKKICYRPLYYKYFDSFDLLQLSGLPEFQYKSWDEESAPSVPTRAS